MLIIEYKPNEILLVGIGDALIENYIQTEIDSFYTLQELYGETFDHTITINTELVIDFFRLAIVDGKIKHTDLVFKYNDELLQPNEDGRLPRWPEGFCDVFSDVLARLMNGARRNHEHRNRKKIFSKK